MAVVELREEAEEVFAGVWVLGAVLLGGMMMDD
jgi:hypothetical protein